MLYEKYEKYYEEENPNLTQSEAIVFALLHEMDGRRGVLDLEMDEDIFEEMLTEMVKITEQEIR